MFLFLLGVTVGLLVGWHFGIDHMAQRAGRWPYSDEAQRVANMKFHKEPVE